MIPGIWAASSYTKIANLCLKQLKYDRFFLEWDDEWAGSLDALAVFKDKPGAEIVLDLLSSKTNTLDDEERVIRMLDEASRIIQQRPSASFPPTRLCFLRRR
jgi:hypothetical protein